MVDRRERWHLQDGQRENRPSQRDLRGHGQRLGRRLQWATRRDVGVSYRAAKSSRGPGSGKKTRGNLPLELRRDFEVDERRRVRFGGCFGPKEIKVAPDRDAAS